MPVTPVPLRLYSPIESRDANLLKDSRLINGIVEKELDRDEGEKMDTMWVSKRPGLINYSTVASPSTGRGVFNWKNNIYSVFGSTLYKDGVSKGTVNVNGLYTFTSTLGATPKLFLKNIASAYLYDDAGGLVAVSDGDYPAATVPGCVYLDGGVYVLNTTNNIIGSNFNAPQTWDPLNTLLVQIEPDLPVALAKQLVYVVALKQTSTEVFYDAGNAVGSPLGPVQGSKMNIGCRDAGTVCDVGGDLAWVGTNGLGSVRVVLMSAVRPETISTPPVERFLAPLNYATVWSWAMSCAGHTYYVVTFVESNFTFVFDLTSRTWYQWTDAGGNYFPIVSASYDVNAKPILQHASDGKLYTADITAFQDVGAAIPLTLYTSNFDGGVRLGKTCSLLEVVGD
jgi:hypothetical protein